MAAAYIMDKKGQSEATIDTSTYLQGAKDMRDFITLHALTKVTAWSDTFHLNDASGKDWSFPIPPTITSIMYTKGASFWSYFQGAYDYCVLLGMSSSDTVANATARLQKVGMYAPQSTISLSNVIDNTVSAAKDNSRTSNQGEVFAPTNVISNPASGNATTVVSQSSDSASALYPGSPQNPRANTNAIVVSSDTSTNSNVIWYIAIGLGIFFFLKKILKIF